MTFSRPEALWLALIAPLAVGAFGWFWRRQLRAIAAWSSASLWPRLGFELRGGRMAMTLIALGVAFLGTALALAKPRWGSTEQLVERRGVDIVFVLDSSLSMQARDVAPSRMEIAKALIRGMLAGLPGHRTALVQAEGKGLVLSPLTVDTAVIDLLLDTVFPASLPEPGTRIGSALDDALELFPPEGEKHRVLILVSDGEDHGSNWREALSRLSEASVIVHTIGVGTRKGTPIELPGTGERRYKQDASGRVVVSKLDPSILEEIAEASGGIYVEVDSPSADPTPLVAAINSMHTRTLTGETLEVAAERFQWPLALSALATALLLLLPPATRSRRLTRSTG